MKEIKNIDEITGGESIFDKNSLNNAADEMYKNLINKHKGREICFAVGAVDIIAHHFQYLIVEQDGKTYVGKLFGYADPIVRLQFDNGEIKDFNRNKAKIYEFKK